MPRGSKPGERRGGRKKGTPNRMTASARAAFEMAFAGAGGVKALREWAKANQTEFYKLYARLIPVEHSGIDGGPIATETRVVFGGRHRPPA